jgi:hypothetical protein
MTLEQTHKLCGARAAQMARGYAAGFGNPREKGNLGGKYEAEPGRLRPITLHGASLTGHMHAAVQKVNLVGEAHTLC